MTETIQFIDELPPVSDDPYSGMSAEDIILAARQLIMDREIGNYRIPTIIEQTDQHYAHSPEKREPRVVAVIGLDDGVREVVDLERLVADDALRLSIYEGADAIDLVPGYTINVLEENARLDMEILRAMERDFVVKSMEPPQHQQDAGWWHKFDRKRNRLR